MKNWGYTTGSILAISLASIFVYWLFKNILKKATHHTSTHLDDHLVEAAQYPVLVYINTYGVWTVLHKFLSFSSGVEDSLQTVLHTVIVFNTAWLLVRILDKILEYYLIPLAEKTESDLDDILLPLLKGSQKWIIFTVAAVIGISRAGYNVSAILTSFGIGGLAVALAAKDTIANIFGGIIVLTSRPFKAGERIKFQSYWAEVLEISLRTTKLQHPDFGYIISVPNSYFLTNPVINIQKSAGYLFFLDLRLSITTEPSMLKKAMEIMADVVAQNPRVVLKDVRFIDFLQSAFTLRAYFHVEQFSQRHIARTEIRLEIQRLFHANDIHFAEIPIVDVNTTSSENIITDGFNIEEFLDNKKRSQTLPGGH